MILPMARVRLIGPRERLTETLEVVQDFGRVQFDRVPATAGLAPAARGATEDRELRYVQRLLDDAEAAIALLGVTGEAEAGAPPAHEELARWARQAYHLRREGDRLRAARQSLDDERVLLTRYRDFLEAFNVLLVQLQDAKHLFVYGVTLPSGERGRVEGLADQLRAELGVEVVVMARTLPSGDMAVLIAVPSAGRERMERALGAAKIAEVPLPAGYEDQSLTQAGPRILARLDAVPREIAKLDESRASIAAVDGPTLLRMRTAARDRLDEARAAAMAAGTVHAFTLEGWLPEADVEPLRKIVDERLRGDIVLEQIAREEWHSSDAPVVLRNPPLFKPFEVLTSIMPLPRYGSIDPTPFVAVGFPMLFGMILGDIGYGAVLGGVGALLLWRTTPATTWHKVGSIALACAAFSIIFGVLFGELFGPMGKAWFGLRPVLFDRESAITTAILLAVGVGLVHVMLGLVLGMVQARHEPRVAASRGVQLVMMVLIVLAILSAVEVLPSNLFGTLGLVVLIGFPVLLFLEGIVAPIEFFSTLSSVLSYVRIMALGTASVLLASVASQMVGMFGGALVGVLLALLFHLVNFAIGVFSPTIHALRLHYVEFFREFYSPGGRPYEPFRHERGHHPPTPRGTA
ncbi:MAG TPA: V-type ATPase 116kDa subunit family protein [Gemmatimonadaceae bacterium]|nr:V-type ATPase 116kDa subunit family protein [Gemmatimonadaceae bacterium]